MKRLLRTTYALLLELGVDPIKTLRFFRGMPHYFRDLKKLKGQRPAAGGAFPFGMHYPCLGDRFANSGSARGHYFHQDLLVARRVHLNRPDIHVDVGSRVDGFVAHVASFRPIEVIDIRPLAGCIPNIYFIQADFMAPLPDELVEYCDSLSCLHALEHFGLGRYGDPVNYDGYRLGLNNLHHMLRNGPVSTVFPGQMNSDGEGVAAKAVAI